MRRIRRLSSGILAVLATSGALLGAAGCTGDDAGGGDADSLPDATALLRDSATAMGEVQTLAFHLDIDGTVPGVGISSADGLLTSDGAVSGTGALITGDATSEIEFVILGERLYLKGPTGGFQELPSSVAATVYDPSRILDPELGVPALLAGASAATTKAADEVDGADAYCIEATLAKEDLGVLLPQVAGDLTGLLWVAADDPKRLLKATVEVPADEGGEPATVTLTLTDFDEPVEITPPN